MFCEDFDWYGSKDNNNPLNLDPDSVDFAIGSHSGDGYPYNETEFKSNN